MKIRKLIFAPFYWVGGLLLGIFVVIMFIFSKLNEKVSLIFLTKRQKEILRKFQKKQWDLLDALSPPTANFKEIEEFQKLAQQGKESNDYNDQEEIISNLKEMQIGMLGSFSKPSKSANEIRSDITSLVKEGLDSGMSKKFILKKMEFPDESYF